VAGGRVGGGVAGGARQRAFQAGEEVEHVGCLEDPVALPADVALAEDPGPGTVVERLSVADRRLWTTM
jgi:hypothetical protein